MKNYLLILICGAVLPLVMEAQTQQNAVDQINAYLSSTENAQRSIDNVEFQIMSSIKDEKSQIHKIQALQTIDGISIQDAIISMATNRKGKVVATNTFTDMKPNTYSPSMTKEKALAISAKRNQIDTHISLSVDRRVQDASDHTIYEWSEAFALQPEVRLVYLQDKTKNQLRLTWMTQLHTADRQHYYVDFIDAVTGEVLRSEDKVLHCEFGDGLVYDASPEEKAQLEAMAHKRHMASAAQWEAQHAQGVHTHDHAHCNHTMTAAVAPANKYLVLDLPAEAPNDDSADNTQTTITTAGDPEASPYGWTSLDGMVQLPYTHGNNVFAFYDPSPGPLGGLPNPATAAQATSNNVLGAQDFIYHWDLTQDPEYSTTSTNNTFPNRNAAIVNLFYHNNLIHDIFYNFGFDEAGRNFQFDNFGKGGEGNDNVLAQAQDGGGTNNANMLTLQDGVNPQMQMYLWTAAGVDELVKITSVDTETFVEGGDEFNAIQGAIYSAVNPYDLHENPVLNKRFVLINDGCGTSNGCGAGAGVGLPPCNDVADAIVLIDRGDCSFVEKVDGAQKGGAAGVIVINNNSSNPDEIVAMGGTDPTGNTVTIPSVMVSYNTGLLLKESLADGATIIGSLQQDEEPDVRKDGDFDNGIIAHEYGHGISSRTSPQGLLGGTLSGSEQGGEGWSDFYALYLTTTVSDLAPSTDDHPNGILPDRGIGTYVRYTDSDGPGIRPRRYSIDMEVNEYTFAGTTNGGIGIGNSAEITVPHGVGFIWCTMLWEMTQNLVDEYGFNDDVTYNPPSGDIQALIDNHAGNNLALKLIQEGISLQAPSPSFIDMRDAILLADEVHYDGAHSCLIWAAFAKRGLGSDAINPSNDIGDERDGYATPCQPEEEFHNVIIEAPLQVENESYVTFDIMVENTTDNNSMNIAATNILPEHFTLTEVTGADYTVEDGIITFHIDEIEANSAANLYVTGYVQSETVSVIKNTYSFESGAEGWLAVTGGINEFYIKNDGGYDGDAYFHADNNGLTGANTMLESPEIPFNGEPRELRFFHKYDTDAGYDGGYVEYTTDGVEWILLPVQRNGYTATLDGLFNLTYTGPAFTGSISEYIESAAALPDDATKVRFVFSEDSGLGGGDGWDIDFVRIVENSTGLISTATATDPVSSGGRTYVDDVHTLILGSTKPTFDVKTNMSVSPAIMNGDTPVRVLVDLMEMSGNGSTGPITIRIRKSDMIGFDFDPTEIVIGGYEVDNDLFTFSENFLFWEFTTTVDITEDTPIRLGFSGDFTPSGSHTMKIISQSRATSKLENNASNDSDLEAVNFTDQD